MVADEPLIRKTPDVMGGEACIRRTRIAVWMLIEAWRLGFTDQEIMARYDPPLTEDDLVAARDYQEKFPDEIEDAIRENNEA